MRVKTTLVSALVLAGVMGCSTISYAPPSMRVWSSENEWWDATSERPFVPRDWLAKEVTMAEIEAAIKSNGAKQNNEYISRSVKNLRSMIKEGDTIWEFESPPSTWAALAGRKGYALVREGTVIAGFVTFLN